MDNDKIILHLMQKVVDRLEEINTKVDNEKASKLDEKQMLEISKTQELFIPISKSIFKNQNLINRRLIKVKEDLETTIKNNKPIIQDNQKEEYYIFGKDTPFTSRLLLFLITFFLIASFGFKYIPNYLVQSSTVTLERDQYKLFYQYVYLNAYDRDVSVSDDVVKTFNKIKNSDSSLLHYINRLGIKHNNVIQKENLEKQLRALKRTE